MKSKPTEIWLWHATVVTEWHTADRIKPHVDNTESFVVCANGRREAGDLAYAVAEHKAMAIMDRMRNAGGAAPYGFTVREVNIDGASREVFWEV